MPLAHSQSFAHSAKFLTLPHKLIIDRPEEVRQRVLQRLGEEGVRRAMKKLLAANNLVLGLKTQRERVSHIGRQSRPGLTGSRLMDVVVDPAPASKEGAKALRVHGLPKRTRIRYIDSVPDLHETVFARYGSRIGATPGNEGLPAIELKPKAEPRH